MGLHSAHVESFFRLAILSIALAVGCKAEHGPPINSSWDAPSMPNTEAGTLVQQFLEVFNSGDLKQIENFTRTNSTEHGPGGSTMEQRVASQLNFYNTTRGMDVFSVEQPNDSQITVVAMLRLKQQWRMMDFFFEGTPKKLAGIRIVPTTAPTDYARRMQSIRKDFHSEIDEFMQRQMEVDQFSGVVFVDHAGKTKYERAFGANNRVLSAANTVETTFHYASTGKMFTAVAIGQLVEAKQLEFDSRLSDLLPVFKSTPVQQATVAQLLSHQSGIPDYFENLEKFQHVAGSENVLQSYLPIFASLSLNFQPGERFEYSNSNFLILGAIIEKYSRLSYEEYIQKNIFERCAMLQTKFVSDENTAIGYTELNQQGEQTPGTRRSNEFVPSGKGSAAGGGVTSVCDLLKFRNGLMTGKLCSLEMVNELIAPRTPAERPGESYGYGFMVRSAGDQTIVGHSGGFPGVDAQFDIYVNKGWTVIVLSNYEAVAEPVARHIESILCAPDSK